MYLWPHACLLLHLLFALDVRPARVDAEACCASALVAWLRPADATAEMCALGGSAIVIKTS